MFKQLAIFLAIACVASASQISDPESVGGEVDDLLKKLQQVVDAAVAKARQELMVAEGVVNNTAAQVEAEAKTALSGLQKTFQQELDELKAKAKSAGVNIDSCLGEDETKLVNLPTSTSNDMVQCVQGLIIQAVNFVNDALTKLQKVVDDVANIKDDIKKCGHGIKSVSCLAKLAIKLGEEIEKLPGQIETDAEGVVDIVENLVPKIKQCGSNAVSNCESQGKALLAKISTCVAEKIIHH